MPSRHSAGYSAVAGPARPRLLLLVVLTVVAALIAGLAIGRALGHAATSVVQVGVPMRDGMPISDRRTAEGAVMAAQNFLVAGVKVGSGELDADRAADVLLAADADSAARTVLTSPATPPAGGRASYAPLSAVVQEFSLDLAEVRVWGVIASSSTSLPATVGAIEDWGRAEVVLAWDEDQWRVRSQRFDKGPWPARSDQRMATTDGDFSFRANESAQGWIYVSQP